MKDSDYTELIEYRLEEAIESLEDAELLLTSKRYRSTVNRLYYAAFYAVVAVLLTKKLQYSKHSAVISFFDKEFIKTGIFPRTYSKTLHHAFFERQQDDYMPFVEFDPNEIEQLGKDVRVLVKGISEHIKTNLH
jgi:uncharacterized protein (UPF0332 family)